MFRITKSLFCKDNQTFYTHNLLKSLLLNFAEKCYFCNSDEYSLRFVEFKLKQ